MGWRKSPPELITAFDAVVPPKPAERRSMFGYPCAFVNGNMFMGLHQEDMVLRLPDSAREQLLAREGARIFEPMKGRPMREYVVVPPALVDRPTELEGWVSQSLEYVATMPPKRKGAKPGAKTTASASAPKAIGGRTITARRAAVAAKRASAPKAAKGKATKAKAAAKKTGRR
jgi:TfoX/Sxy family transcriptional regulator of competence genes